MSIYHYHRGIGKRHEGKNAVFRAAYIRGERYACHRTQVTKDYTYRTDVIYTACFLPADAPDWLVQLSEAPVENKQGQWVVDEHGRALSEYVWNQLEFAERYQNAQLYFEDDFALPIELDKTAAIALVRSFVQDTLVRDGHFCDVAIHWDAINPHAHVMFPIRAFSDTGFEKKKQRFTPEVLSQWITQQRAHWAEYANNMLASHHIDARIDHRSHKDRGLDLIPMVKEGYPKTFATEEAWHTSPQAQNHRIRAENRKKIQADPSVLIKKLAQEHTLLSTAHIHQALTTYATNAAVLQHQSIQEKTDELMATLATDTGIFNAVDLKARVLACTDNQAECDALVKQVCNHEDLLCLGLGEDGRLHYVTRAVFNKETALIHTTLALMKKNSLAVSAAAVEQAIASHTLNEHQERALRYITQGKQLALVVGAAGSGKTYMLKAANQVWKGEHRRVYGVAFSARAAAGLAQEAQMRSYTIARFLKNVELGHIRLDSQAVVVMDEMGMTSLDDAHSVLQVVNAAGAQLVGVGDSEQTQPVGRGAPFRAMLEQAGFMRMDGLMRQKIPWQRDATLAMETQRTAAAFDAYKAHGRIHLADNAVAAQALLLDQWQDAYPQQEDAPVPILIAHKNETVAELNQLARERLVALNLLQESRLFSTTQGDLAIALGERLHYCRNDYTLGVKNGLLGTVIGIEKDTLTVRNDDGTTVTFNMAQYADITYGYAATVHKLQGLTTDKAFVYIDGRGWDRHLFLVAVSRHREDVTIIADETQHGTYDDLKEVLCRYGLRDHVYDYPAHFAIRRGFDATGVIAQAMAHLGHVQQRIKDGWQWLWDYQRLQDDPPYELHEQQEALTHRRDCAVIVAEFRDTQKAIGEHIDALKALPGYRLALHYCDVPLDEEVIEKTVFLYAEKDHLFIAYRDEDDALHRHALRKTDVKQTLWHDMLCTLNDDHGVEQLSKTTRTALYGVLANYGIQPPDEQARIALLKTIYGLRLENSKSAKTIEDNRALLQTAMDLNRVTRRSLASAIAFGERHHFIGQLKAGASQPCTPLEAYIIMANFSLYHGHIIAHFGNTEKKHALVNILRAHAHQYCYETALDVDENRHYPSLAHIVYQYFQWDDATQGLDFTTLTQEQQTLLVQRNTLAHHIVTDFEAYERVFTHFLGDKQRLLRQHHQHQRYQQVATFARHIKAYPHQHHPVAQFLAYRIVQWPRGYGFAVDQLLQGQWSTVYRYGAQGIRRKRYLRGSPDFKAAYKTVCHYQQCIQQGEKASQRARRCCRRGSPKAAYWQQQAQAWRYLGDKSAVQIINNIDSYIGALGFARVDLAALTAQAQQFEDFQHTLNHQSPMTDEKRHTVPSHDEGYPTDRPVTVTSKKIPQKQYPVENREPLWSVERIREALMAQPQITYEALWGAPKKRTPREWRYPDGLVVTLTGEKAGLWYDFGQGIGGDPIKAIQRHIGGSFKEVLAYGARLAGLSDAQAQCLPQEKRRRDVTAKKPPAPVDNTHRIAAAVSIWEGTVPLAGTLAERYLREHRHITDTDPLAVRYWPVGAPWKEVDSEGQWLEKTNKIPAAVLALENAHGEITGVQRIYLDKTTANKAHFMDNPKLSKGVVQGSAGIIQRGQWQGRVYVAEGPETGASLALADPDATVLVATGLHNLKHLAPVIQRFSPSKVILAGDNDGEDSTTRRLTQEAYKALQAALPEELDCTLVIPPHFCEHSKVDWNDILKHQGLAQLRQHLMQGNRVQQATDTAMTVMTVEQSYEQDKAVIVAKDPRYEHSELENDEQDHTQQTALSASKQHRRLGSGYKNKKSRGRGKKC